MGSSSARDTNKMLSSFNPCTALCLSPLFLVAGVSAHFLCEADTPPFTSLKWVDMRQETLAFKIGLNQAGSHFICLLYCHLIKACPSRTWIPLFPSHRTAANSAQVTTALLVDLLHLPRADDHGGGEDDGGGPPAGPHPRKRRVHGRPGPSSRGQPQLFAYNRSFLVACRWQEPLIPIPQKVTRMNFTSCTFWPRWHRNGVVLIAPNHV